MTLKGIDEKTVVHCPTEELANKVLGIADRAGLKWCTGESFKELNRWNKFRELSCYDIIYGSVADVQVKSIYSENKILPAEEFIRMNTLEEFVEGISDDTKSWMMVGKDEALSIASQSEEAKRVVKQLFPELFEEEKWKAILSPHNTEKKLTDFRYALMGLLSEKTYKSIPGTHDEKAQLILKDIFEKYGEK